MERVLARWFATQLGMGPAANAIFTSGGSLGNLTALLAARANKAAHAWDERLHAGPPLLTINASQVLGDRALSFGLGSQTPRRPGRAGRRGRRDRIPGRAVRLGRGALC